MMNRGVSTCASKSHFNWHPMCSGHQKVFPCTDSVCQHGTKSAILAPLSLPCLPLTMLATWCRLQNHSRLWKPTLLSTAQ